MRWNVPLAAVLPSACLLTLVLLARDEDLEPQSPPILVMEMSCCSGLQDLPGQASIVDDSTSGLEMAADEAPVAPGKGGIIKGKVGSRWFKRREGAVFIRKVEGKKFAPPKKSPELDQRNLTFIPHVLPVVAGSTVSFLNNDNVKHNVHSTKKSPTQFNLGLFGNGETKKVKFEKEGVVALLCNVHAEMSAYLLVCQNPYFSRVDTKDGTFEIKNVPPGKYKLAVFHEKVKTADLEVTVKAGETTTATFGKFTKK